MNMPVPEPSPEPGPAQPPLEERRLSPWLVWIALLILTICVGILARQILRTPARPDLGPALAALDARMSKLEHQPPASVAGPDLTPRVEALERRAPPDLSSLQTRIAGLEQRPPGDTEALTTRIAALEKSLGRADRVAKASAAALALNAGRPIDDMPGAPAALARFAHANPPTEAALKLAFPAAANAALNASRPEDDGRPIMDRLLARAEDLVTIRQGDHVVVGDPAAGILVRARSALDAGDLAGAVAALADLKGPSAAAMSHWLADATALRDARTALADLAAQP